MPLAKPSRVYRGCVGVMAVSAALSAALPVQAQLSPPGAPADSMLPLDQVEPRTPISSLPIIINEPGSYFLTRSISTDGPGITITANNVTLDLMGFTMSGDGGIDDGIQIGSTFGENPTRNITVRNGTIRAFDVGLVLNSTQDCRFSGLTIEDCAGYGISVLGGVDGSENNTFEDSSIVRNGNGGFFCSPGSGGLSGLSIARSRIERNDGPGLYLFVSSALSQGVHVSDSHFIGNANRGIFLQVQSGVQSSGHTLERNVVSFNGAEGIEITVSGAGSLSERISIVDCQISRNGNDGLRTLSLAGGQLIDNRIIGCEIIGNGFSGIDTSGLSRSRIEGNTVSGNSDFGIRLSNSAGNFVLKNIAAGNAPDSNYFFGVNDVHGPLVTAPGVLADTGASVHPWANFSY